MRLKFYSMIFLLAAFQLSVAQQVPREEVLLEGFTGTW